MSLFGKMIPFKPDIKIPQAVKEFLEAVMVEANGSSDHYPAHEACRATPRTDGSCCHADRREGSERDAAATTKYRPFSFRSLRPLVGRHCCIWFFGCASPPGGRPSGVDSEQFGDKSSQILRVSSQHFGVQATPPPALRGVLRRTTAALRVGPGAPPSGAPSGATTSRSAVRLPPAGGAISPRALTVYATHLVFIVIAVVVFGLFSGVSNIIRATE